MCAELTPKNVGERITKFLFAVGQDQWQLAQQSLIGKLYPLVINCVIVQQESEGTEKGENAVTCRSPSIKNAKQEGAIRLNGH
jgi:hypothetical protein